VTGLAVVLAGSVGSVLRHLLDTALRRNDTWPPSGIVAANVVGSFVLAVVSGLATQGRIDHDIRTVIAVGLCGGFTTMSTVALDTRAAIATDRTAAGAANVLLNVVASVLAASIGTWLTR
jgi:CrcB protein